MNRSESLEWSFRSILGEELIQTPGVGGNDADSKMLWVTWIQMWVSVAVCDAQGWRRPVTVFRAATSSPESASRPPLEGKTSVGDSAPWTSSFCQGCPFLATGSWGKWTVRDPGQRDNRNSEDWWGWASLVTQWLRIRLPMQETWVRSLVWEDPACCRATKPVHHNYWACVPQLLSLLSRACEPQLLSPWSHS